MDRYDEKAHDMCETLNIKHGGNRAVIASALREAAAEAYEDAALRAASGDGDKGNWARWKAASLRAKEPAEKPWECKKHKLVGGTSPSCPLCPPAVAPVESLTEDEGECHNLTHTWCPPTCFDCGKPTPNPRHFFGEGGK